MTTQVARLVHDMRMARVREALHRDLVRFVSDLNATARLDAAIRRAEEAIAAKRRETREGI